MTEIFKLLKYINKITSVDNLSCIINGVFYGVFRTVQHEQQRYHESRIGSAVVFENLNSECSGAIGSRRFQHSVSERKLCREAFDLR